MSQKHCFGTLYFLTSNLRTPGITDIIRIHTSSPTYFVFLTAERTPEMADGTGSAEDQTIRSALRPTTSLRHARAWIEQNGLTSSRKRRSSYLILSSEIALSLYCSTVDITRVAPHPLCQHANDTARGTHSDNVRWSLSLSLFLDGS